MVKIYQGELPKIINVVVKGKVLTKAVFVDGVYETEDKAVIQELKEYGYKVEGTVKEKLTVEETAPSPLPFPEGRGSISEKPAKPKKKKEIE